MRHHNSNRKFGRVRKQRKALLCSLAVSLLEKESIKTTEAKAKELRPFVEKLITRGKSNSIFTKRLLRMKLGSSHSKLIDKLTNDLAQRYTERAGGYTRIVKITPRSGDGSPMAHIELIKN